MRKYLVSLVVLGLVLNVNLPASDPQAASNAERPDAAGPPPIVAQVTFLYFNDLEKAAEFYGQTLGLRATSDGGWWKIFALSPTSSIGLVDAVHGIHRPSPIKPVRISLVVEGPEQVDRWFAYLNAKGVKVPKPPGGGAAVRSFGFSDPEGHTLEVFAWLKK